MNKIVTGFVIQTFDDDGRCTEQSFIAGEDAQWENNAGEPIAEPDVRPWYPLNMEQPK